MDQKLLVDIQILSQQMANSSNTNYVVIIQVEMMIIYL